MSRIKVMITDDDPAVQTVIAEVAHALGCDVDVADDLESFQQVYNSFHPTLIFLDLNLKQADGIEVMRFLSEAECKLPIHVLSAQDEKVISTAVHLGHDRGLNMCEPIQKPIDIHKIKELIAKQNENVVELTEADITEGIQKDEFYFVFQPKIDVVTRNLVGVEALSRWNRENHGIVYPDTFITIAEKTGCIRILSRYLVEKSFKILAQEEFDFNMAVNLSAHDLINIRLPDEMMHLLNKYPVNPKLITFEITETALMAHYKIIMDILSRFRIMGFSLSLDDFGTGYSSLVELYKLPFSEMKIDRSFVMRLPEDKDALVIVKSIIALGHNLGIRVTAEGVESPAALDQLAELGCDMAQGYYISKPVSLNGLKAFIKKQEN